MEVPNLFPSHGSIPAGRSPILVDADAMAKQLGISRSTLLRLVRAGRVPSIRVSDRLVRFDPSAVLNAVQESEKD